MLKRDFIMVQIEELAKVVLQIITNRNTGATRKIPDMVQSVYTSLKLDRETLLSSSPEDLIARLNQDDEGGIQRLEIAIKTLIEESYLYPDQQKEILLKAKELLLYIQMHDNTFSLERVALLQDIENKI